MVKYSDALRAGLEAVKRNSQLLLDLPLKVINLSL
jgi:hypothetical protein